MQRQNPDVPRCAPPNMILQPQDPRLLQNPPVGMGLGYPSVYSRPPATLPYPLVPRTSLYCTMPMYFPTSPLPYQNLGPPVNTIAGQTAANDTRTCFRLLRPEYSPRPPPPSVMYCPRQPLVLSAPDPSHKQQYVPGQVPLALESSAVVTEVQVLSAQLGNGVMESRQGTTEPVIVPMLGASGSNSKDDKTTQKQDTEYDSSSTSSGSVTVTPIKFPTGTALTSLGTKLQDRTPKLECGSHYSHPSSIISNLNPECPEFKPSGVPSLQTGSLAGDSGLGEIEQESKVLCEFLDAEAQTTLEGIHLDLLCLECKRKLDCSALSGLTAVDETKAANETEDNFTTNVMCDKEKISSDETTKDDIAHHIDESPSAEEDTSLATSAELSTLKTSSSLVNNLATKCTLVPTLSASVTMTSMSNPSKTVSLLDNSKLIPVVPSCLDQKPVDKPPDNVIAGSGDIDRVPAACVRIQDPQVDGTATADDGVSLTPLWLRNKQQPQGSVANNGSRIPSCFKILKQTQATKGIRALETPSHQRTLQQPHVSAEKPVAACRKTLEQPCTAVGDNLSKVSSYLSSLQQASRDTEAVPSYLSTLQKAQTVVDNTTKPPPYVKTPHQPCARMGDSKEPVSYLKTPQQPSSSEPVSYLKTPQQPSSSIRDSSSLATSYPPTLQMPETALKHLLNKPNRQTGDAAEGNLYPVRNKDEDIKHSMAEEFLKLQTFYLQGLTHTQRMKKYGNMSSANTEGDAANRSIRSGVLEAHHSRDNTVVPNQDTGFSSVQQFSSMTTPGLPSQGFATINLQENPTMLSSLAGYAASKSRQRLVSESVLTPCSSASSSTTASKRLTRARSVGGGRKIPPPLDLRPSKKGSKGLSSRTKTSSFSSEDKDSAPISLQQQNDPNKHESLYMKSETQPTSKYVPQTPEQFSAYFPPSGDCVLKSNMWQYPSAGSDNSRSSSVETGEQLLHLFPLQMKVFDNIASPAESCEATSVKNVASGISKIDDIDDFGTEILSLLDATVHDTGYRHLQPGCHAATMNQFIINEQSNGMNSLDDFTSDLPVTDSFHDRHRDRLVRNPQDSFRSTAQSTKTQHDSSDPGITPRRMPSQAFGRSSSCKGLLELNKAHLADVDTKLQRRSSCEDQTLGSLFVGAVKNDMLELDDFDYGDPTGSNRTRNVKMDEKLLGMYNNTNAADISSHSGSSRVGGHEQRVPCDVKQENTVSSPASNQADEWHTVGKQRRGSKQCSPSVEEFRQQEKYINLTSLIVSHFPALTRPEAQVVLEEVFVVTQGMVGMRQPQILEEIRKATRELYPDKSSEEAVPHDIESMRCDATSQGADKCGMDKTNKKSQNKHSSNAENDSCKNNRNKPTSSKCAML